MVTGYETGQFCIIYRKTPQIPLPPCSCSEGLVSSFFSWSMVVEWQTSGGLQSGSQEGRGMNSGVFVEPQNCTAKHLHDLKLWINVGGMVVQWIALWPYSKMVCTWMRERMLRGPCNGLATCSGFICANHTRDHQIWPLNPPLKLIFVNLIYCLIFANMM